MTLRRSLLLVSGLITLAASPVGAKEVPAAAAARMRLPGDARVVSAPTAKGQGASARLESQACVSGKPTNIVARDVTGALMPEWGTINVYPNPNQPGRCVLTAEKDGLALSAVIDSVVRGPCAAGEVQVRLSVLSAPEPKPGEKPSKASRTVAAPGIRSAKSSRPPMVIVPEGSE